MPPSKLKKIREHPFTEFLKEFAQVIQESNVFMVASSLAYTTILSIIPVLVVSFAIFQAFGGMDKLVGVIQPLIVENLTQGAGDEALQTVQKLIGSVHAGAVGASGLVGLLFTSMSLLSNCEKAIKKIWRIETQRPVFYRIASYWFFITLGPLFISVLIGASAGATGSITKFMPSGTGTFALLSAFFILVYKVVPGTEVKWRSAFLAAIYTAGLWTFARAGYVYYAAHVVSYNKLYGSLGAIPIILVWIYISWVVVLSGAALGYLIQRRVLK